MIEKNKIKKAKRIVIKIGTSIITSKNRPNYIWLKSIINEIADLQKKGKEIMIVTSGAVGAGMMSEGLNTRPKEPLKLQLLSGKGQPILMGIYERGFSKYGIHTAQVLLTHHNFSSNEERENIKLIINEYLKEGTIPIINANDVITKEEFIGHGGGFSDNDELASLVAVNLNVELLLILTDVEGLYTKDPRSDDNVIFIPEVKSVTEEIISMATKEGNSLGRGGMYSKVIAARDVRKLGIVTIVANGKYNVSEILNGDVRRTVFY